MSKNGKKLLNENTIRRFMKLAEIDTLSDQFVGTLTEKYGDGGLEEGRPYNRDDDEGAGTDVVEEEEGAPFDMTDVAAEEEGIEDMEDDLPPEPEDAPAPAAGVEAIFTDLAQALAGVAEEHGVSMDIEGGEGEEPADLGGEEDLDMAPEEGPPEEEEVGEDDMVAEITRRVTARLMKESRDDKVADQLAERIMARLKSTSSDE